MMNESLTTLNADLNWLNQFIQYRFAEYFQHAEQLDVPPAPDINLDQSFYAELIREFRLDEIDRLIIIIALAPHIKPSLLDVFFTKNEQFDRVFTEFGGLKGEKHNGFVPTGETASFVIAGSDPRRRMELQKRFSEKGVLYTKNLIKLGFTNVYEPFWSGELIISQELLTHLTINQPYQPRFSPDFPAELLTTELGWDDAYFDPIVHTEIEHIHAWIGHKEAIMGNHQLGRFLKEGYRVLFYGPPGTGKSMTAALIGKSNQIDVYRVDLSAVVSKFIGETEKNLAHLFDIAENKNWILFFDEADALFSKRLATKSSNDMFANQQVAYLLQRIENYNGLVILATNFKDNIDDAFLRRFQSIIPFSNPSADMRSLMWRHYFSEFEISNEDLEEIAMNYEISGGGIINVLRYCAVVAAQRKSNHIDGADILKGIKKELLKEGVTM